MSRSARKQSAGHPLLHAEQVRRHAANLRKPRRQRLGRTGCASHGLTHDTRPVAVSVFNVASGLARRARFEVALSEYPAGVRSNSPGSRRFAAHPGTDRKWIVPRRGSIVSSGAGCNPCGVRLGWCREPRVRDEAPRPWAIRSNPCGVARWRPWLPRVTLRNRPQHRSERTKSRSLRSHKQSESRRKAQLQKA